jgi:hypothetical protein
MFLLLVKINYYLIHARKMSSQLRCEDIRSFAFVHFRLGKNGLTLWRMEEGVGVIIGDHFLKIRIFNNADRAKGMAYKVALLKGNELKFILPSSFRVFLVFFVFLFQSFTQVAFAFAFHFWPVPVLAKVFSNVGFVQLVIQHNDMSAESLPQHT